MSVWVLLQIAFNIVLLLGGWILWAKFRRPPKDDPRLSRGLQLLQSKISVLEDLSDKTDHQVKQIVNVLEKKGQELQSKMREATDEIQRVENSIQKSLEVSEIFEDRIPHKEIIERKRTKDYVYAAQLAHSGVPVNEIAQKIDLPIGEIELIAKVNKDKLMFSTEQLPSWVPKVETSDEEIRSAAERVDFSMPDKQMIEEYPEPRASDIFDTSTVFKPIIERPQSLEDLGQEFRKACDTYEKEQQEFEVESAAEKIISQMSSGAVHKIREFSEGAKQTVKSTVEKTVKKIADDLEAPFAAPVEEAQIEEGGGFVKVDVAQEVIQKPSSASVEVIRQNSSPGTRGVSEKKNVSVDQIQKVAFPRIDQAPEI